MRNILVIILVLLANCTFSQENLKINNKHLPDTALVSAGNKFAFDLYSKLTAKYDNLVVSPQSVFIAMAMTLSGCKNKTADEIANVLHLNDFDKQNLPPKYNDYLIYLKKISSKKPSKIYIANAAFAQKNYLFLDEFRKTVKNEFISEFKCLNFKEEPELSRNYINKWVCKKTKKKIIELIQKGFINELTRLVLVNTIYFYCDWKTAFDETKTTKDKFYLLNGNYVNTDFMKATVICRYEQFEGFKAIKLDYSNLNFSMMVLLPDKNEGLVKLERMCNNNFYKIVTMKVNAYQNVHITIPKFDFKTDIKLSDYLKEMGIHEAFSPDADLSGMTGNTNLVIDEVIHSAKITVNEKGTEASAATAVVIREKSTKYNPIHFKADHPFLFIIQDEVFKSILFIGKVVNPVN